jgi:hypothetical protein
MRQCGEDVLRMFVTGGPPIRGGGGIPHRIIASSRPVFVLRMTGTGKSGKTPGIAGKLPTYRLTTRNNPAMAAWFVVIE